MQIIINYNNIINFNYNIQIIEDYYTIKNNYNLRQSKKFIKDLLTYDYNYLKEGNFNKDIYYKIITITCVDKYNKYEFISNLESRKLTKIRYIENGKQIFEGDILEDKQFEKYFIKYSDTLKRFTICSVHWSIEEDYCGDCDWDEYIRKDFEKYKPVIIGNIYENKELLEK